MEFLIPTSIAAILVAVALAIFVTLQTLIDGIATSRSRKLYRHFVEAGKLHTAHTITAIITLSKKAESITPLLDHLLESGYEKLHVIVLMKHTAGKHAKTELESYRRKNKMKNLRLIQFQKGITNNDLSKRYTDGHIFIELLPESRLAPGFFETLSNEFLLTNSVAIIPKQVRSLNATLTSAFASHSAAWKSLLSFLPGRLVSVPSNTPLVAFRVNDEHALSSVQAKKAYTATVLLPAIDQIPTFIRSSITSIVNRLSARKVFGIIIIITAFIVSLFALPTVEDIFIAIGVVTGLSMLLYIFNLSRVKGYSPSDRIALVLLTPFVFVYSIAVWIVAICMYILQTLSRHTTVATRSVSTKARQ